MHKRRVNQLTLTIAIRPQGPLLIKSGRESGADPTLLDMNFVRTYHARLGENTVYLPGSSLKGTLRSYCEKIARTLAADSRGFPPFSCNPLGGGRRPGRDDYFCGRFLENVNDAQQQHRDACPICRTFGHTSLAAHVQVGDAYPLHPAQPDDRTLFAQANDTGQRDGVAIDRVSGAVAVGPFNLEVVTQGAFYATLLLHNFQLWQVGLLAVALRDLGRGQVPIGFGKSRGLGRVAVDLVRAEAAYPGRFALADGGRRYDQKLYGVSAFLGDAELKAYDYVEEDAVDLPPDFVVVDEGDFGRVALAWEGQEAIENLWRACMPAWAGFAAAWPAREAQHE